MDRPQALVVADDLTGAMETGNAFAARGYSTLVEFDADATTPYAPAVRVVDTDTRDVDPADAGAVVKQTVEHSDAAVVYKKIDSTLRGNVRTAVEATLTARGTDCALVAPAFPATGRTTAAGYHLLDGSLVTDTTTGDDPDAPARTAHLPALFADGDHAVIHCDVGTVAAGAGAVKRAVRDAATPAIVVGDATHESHLAALADGVAGSERSAVYVGSAGLARHVRVPGVATPEAVAAGAEGGEADATAGRPIDKADGRPWRVVGIAGSAAPETVAGVQALPASWVVDLDLDRAVRDPADAAAAAAERLTTALAAEDTVILTSAPDEDAPDRALAAGETGGISGATVRERVERSLALAAATVWKRSPPDAVFLAGGAVAAAVLGALDARSVELTGETVEAGVPVGRIAGGVADGAAVVTKAGAFGNRRTIANCLAHLCGNDG